MPSEKKKEEKKEQKQLETSAPEGSLSDRIQHMQELLLKEGKPYKRLVLETLTESQKQNDEIGKRVNTVESRLGRIEADTAEIKAAFETTSTLLDSIMKFLDQKLPSRSEVEPIEWDPTKISWQQAKGRAGPYERSDDVNNLDFDKMLQELGRCDGKLQRDGLFYWTFQNGTTVGRKKARYPKKK